MTGIVSQTLNPGETYTLQPNNPTYLNVSHNFAPGDYRVTATTNLDATFLGLKKDGNPIGDRGFKVIAAVEAISNDGTPTDVSGLVELENAVFTGPHQQSNP